MFLCILSHDGEVALHQDLPAEPEPFLQAIAPYREDIVVAAACGRRAAARFTAQFDDPRRSTATKAPSAGWHSRASRG